MFSQQRPRFSSFGSKTYLRFALIFSSTKAFVKENTKKYKKLPQFSPHDSFSAGKKTDAYAQKKCNSYYYFAIPDHKVYTSCGSIVNICWYFYQCIFNSDTYFEYKKNCNWTFEWGIRISSHQIIILYFQNIHQTKWI